MRNSGYYEYLAEELRDAMHRAGTDEDTVLETLIGSTPEEIQIIRRHYSKRELVGEGASDNPPTLE